MKFKFKFQQPVKILEDSFYSTAKQGIIMGFDKKENVYVALVNDKYKVPLEESEIRAFTEEETKQMIQDIMDQEKERQVEVEKKMKMDKIVKSANNNIVGAK